MKLETTVGIDLRHEQWHTTEELETIIERYETEAGQKATLILIHFDQEKWLKFELFQRGIPVEGKHISMWQNRQVILTDTYDGHVCDCGKLHL